MIRVAALIIIGLLVLVVVFIVGLVVKHLKVLEKIDALDMERVYEKNNNDSHDVSFRYFAHIPIKGRRVQADSTTDSDSANSRRLGADSKHSQER